MDWKRVNFYVGLTILILAIILVFNGSAEAQDYNLKRYSPLKEGITWNYLQIYNDGSKNYEVLCIGGTEQVNGIVTIKEWGFDSGEIEYYDYIYECKAWTGQGLTTYKSVRSDGSYVNYDPPLTIPHFASLGDTFEQNSTCTEYDPDGNVVSIWSYISQITLEAEEDVTVRAGHFSGCLKISVRELDEGEWSDITLWLAPRIGDVKRVFAGKESRELLSFTAGRRTFYPID